MFVSLSKTHSKINSLYETSAALYDPATATIEAFSLNGGAFSRVFSLDLRFLH
ncbi:hypothetical protein LguiA_012768 [Lonicera macranthoides]